MVVSEARLAEDLAQIVDRSALEVRRKIK